MRTARALAATVLASAAVAGTAPVAHAAAAGAYGVYDGGSQESDGLQAPPRQGRLEGVTQSGRPNDPKASGGPGELRREAAAEGREDVGDWQDPAVPEEPASGRQPAAPEEPGDGRDPDASKKPGEERDPVASQEPGGQADPGAPKAPDSAAPQAPDSAIPEGPDEVDRPPGQDESDDPVGEAASADHTQQGDRGESAVDVRPKRVAPGGSVTISVSCQPGAGTPPETITATSGAFEQGQVQLRRVRGDDGAVAVTAYHGTARIPSAGSFEGGSDASGQAFGWGVDGECPGGGQWSASFTVAGGADAGTDANVAHGVHAGDGGSFAGSPAAMISGGVLIAGAIAAGAYRVYRREGADDL